MNGSPANSSASRLARLASVPGCCLIALALLGAAKPAAKTSIATASDHFATKPAAALHPAGGDLMHDIPAPAAEPADATLASATFSGLTLEHKKVVWVEVTAYCSCRKCCGPHAQGLTASGRPISYNGGQFVAADTKLFKFGTRIQIPGYADGQPVEVIDRGGAIKGFHLDVYFPTHEAARQWGRKWLAVTVEE